MRNRIVSSLFALTCLAFSPSAWTQERGFGRASTETQPDKDVTPGPGWKTCPRCTNNKQLQAAYKPITLKAMLSIRMTCPESGATTASSSM